MAGSYGQINPKGSVLSPFEDAAPRWRRSARCGANGSCVEVAALSTTDRLIGTRDTKRGEQSPVLTFSQDEWRAFIGRVKDGVFDL
ncbi:DUF397 domain-containing protein [Spirillospora sp. CA-253888]